MIPHIDTSNAGTAPTARHGVVNMRSKLIYESTMMSKSKHCYCLLFIVIVILTVIVLFIVFVM